MDYTGLIALALYTTLLIISIIIIYVYYISNKFLPNFMINSTMWLIIGILINNLSSWLLRLASLFNLFQIHNSRDIITLAGKAILLITLVNFLNTSVKKVKKEKK